MTGILLLLLLPLSACSGVQSALDPGGEAARQIGVLSWVLFIGAAVILAAVVGLTVYAVRAEPRRRRWLAGEAAIVGGGLLLPIAVLTALLVYGLLLTRPAAGPPALRLRVTGEQWWWRVDYLEPDGGTAFATANEIRLPVGQPVELLLDSADVIHSFWVPSLAGKLDMIPGHTNRLRLLAERPGRYRGQCAEYCGGPHGRMAFHVVALAPAEFDLWRQAQVQPAAEPQAEAIRQGRAAFLAAGCGGCHTVRGTAAAGRVAPDLTHVGGRLFIGAGLLPTTPANLAAWIVANQHLKPENQMPEFDLLSGDEVQAIAAYLASLR